jgi:ABC-type Mn2+/Zn2+ transport system permease subunit
MLLTAAVAALVATVTGSVLASRLHRETGPLIVTLSATGFFLPLFPRFPRRA